MRPLSRSIPLLLVLFLHSSADEERWIRIQSPSFEIYSSAGERSTRETLKYFEEVRTFFLQAFKSREAKPDPTKRIYLVAFGSRKEFALYRPVEFAAAYYQATPQRDYIVLGETGSETFPTAVHEYVHLWVNHQNLHFPPWLNEGLAELFSTLKPTGKEIAVGGAIAGRVQALQQEKWVPLAAIVSADQKSPYYHETSKAGALYNEGWALTHMLALSTQYGANPIGQQFNELLAAISAGTPSEDALRRVYGKSLRQIEKDLREYLRGGEFRTPLFSLRFLQPTETLAAEPASDIDIGLALADLSLRPGNESAVQKSIEQLSAQAPTRPEPYAALGYLAWRSGRSDEAVKNFAKAYSLGDRDPRMLWDFGRMAEGTDSTQAAEVLAKLLEQDTQRLDVRLELAEVQVRMNQHQNALATLSTIRNIDKADAPRLFKIMAYAQQQSGDRDGARKSAERMKQESRSETDLAEAERILGLLGGDRPPVRASAVPRPPSAALGGRPVLRRQEVRSETGDRPPGGPTQPFVQGSFVRLDCLGGEANFVVQTATGEMKTFRIKDPGQITVGATGGAVDLTCGPQKPEHSVRIEYDPSADRGVDGIVKSIQFDTPRQRP